MWAKLFITRDFSVPSEEAHPFGGAVGRDLWSFWKPTIVRTRDIIRDIVTKKKLRKLRREVESMRSRGGVAADEIKVILRALGRVQDGKVWRSEAFPNLRPIPVHDHPGDMNRFTKDGILADLDSDIFEWEVSLDDEEHGEGEE